MSKYFVVVTGKDIKDVGTYTFLVDDDSEDVRRGIELYCNENCWFDWVEEIDFYSLDDLQNSDADYSFLDEYIRIAEEIAEENRKRKEDSEYKEFLRLKEKFGNTIK